MNTVTLTQKEFNDLPEYSCSLPSGTTIGKQWKRKNNYYDESKGWTRGTYSRLIDKDTVEIIWEKIWVAAI